MAASDKKLMSVLLAPIPNTTKNTTHVNHQNLHGKLLLSSSIGVDIFFSLILSYFCRLVAAFNPCHGKLPLRKYMSTYPNDSISSLRLCSVVLQ